MKDSIKAIRLSTDETKLFFDQGHGDDTIFYNKVGDKYSPVPVYIETHKLQNVTGEIKEFVTGVDVCEYSVIVFSKQFPLSLLHVLRGKTIGLVFTKKEWVNEDNKFPIFKTIRNISIFTVEDDLSLKFIKSEPFVLVE